MRIYRRQKTLWRVGVVAFVDLLVLCAAGLVTSGGSATDTASTAAYVISPRPDAGNQVVPVTITIEADSTVYLDGIPTSLEDLGARIAEAVRISGGGLVTVEPDSGVPFSTVANTMAVAGAAGATSLSLVSQPPAGGS